MGNEEVLSCNVRVLQVNFLFDDSAGHKSGCAKKVGSCRKLDFSNCIITVEKKMIQKR